MARKTSKKKAAKTVEAITHGDEKRTNIPTAELEPMVSQQDKSPLTLRYPRNTDLDPQLVWRGKDEQDQSDLVVNAPPLYIQEKVHPKVLIEDLLKESKKQDDDSESAESGFTADLFGDFNGLPDEARSTEFYQHEANWTNRMILGDSLQVMASLAEREGLRGKVQCIYFDPPYGIKFNSNFQWSTTSRDVKDGKADHITREPEQVKAFRDTWKDGIHSYLTYLRDRLTVARDLLSETGSIFVQIGDENVHRVRSLLDEVFGEDRSAGLIAFTKGATGLGTAGRLSGRLDYLVWYTKSANFKYRQLFEKRSSGVDPNFNWLMMADGSIRRLSKNEKNGKSPLPVGARVFQDVSLTKPGPGQKYDIEYRGRIFNSGKRWWGMQPQSLERALKSGRVSQFGNALRQLRFQDESSAVAVGNLWDGFLGQTSPVYVVQTNVDIVQRCVLMTTDPGDVVLDPTCGSGTTASVSEMWGRRWITIDSSRVALALSRSRLMGSRFPYFLLIDSREGAVKEAEIKNTDIGIKKRLKNIKYGFVYQRVPRVTLRDVAQNIEIDLIWEKYQLKSEGLREKINGSLGSCWLDWEIPHSVDESWTEEAKELHSEWWQLRSAMVTEIEKSIAAKADFEYLYDKPYEDKTKVRVAGPFTVESLSPHRMLAVDHDDELIDPADNLQFGAHSGTGVDDFVTMVLDNLRTAGVQQSAKDDKIAFSMLQPWPGSHICAEGRYQEGESELEKRAGIFIGPEFGTVSRNDLVQATRECADAGFEVLIACAFNFEAHATDFDKLGAIPVLKARMNADLHMADDLKNTGKGNLFVVFGEPDIDLIELDNNRLQIKVNGVDVFHPSTGEVRSDGTEGIACWFLDTDYNDESFFVRHAYFLGAGDPYKSLKTTLKAEINAEAWETLYSDTSRPFRKPNSGRVAVKVINHLGDEVMKVFNVS